MAALSRLFELYTGSSDSSEMNFVTFGELVKVNLPEKISTIKANNLQNCNYCIYTLVKGKVFPLQALLWPRGWVEV